MCNMKCTNKKKCPPPFFGRGRGHLHQVPSWFFFEDTETNDLGLVKTQVEKPH